MSTRAQEHKGTRKTWLIILGSIIAIIIIFAIVFHRQIGQYLTRKSTELLSKSLKADINARQIKGNLFTGIEFSDVSIKFASGDSFNAADVQAEYDLLAIIFRKAKNVNGLKIIKPTIFLYSHPVTQKSETKFNLPLTLPMLMINHIEIKDGSILYDEKLLLDSFSVRANLHLSPTSGNFYINRLKFILLKPDLRVQHLQGNINLSNNILSLQNIKIISDNSSINFDGRYDLTKSLLNFDIKNGKIDLSDFTENKGNIIINSSITAKINPSQLFESRIEGKIDYQNSNIMIDNFSIPDGQGVFNCYDTILKISHISNNPAQNSNIEIDANVFIKDLSYYGNAMFTNFQIPFTNLQFPFDGTLNFRGVKTDSVDFDLFGSCQNPKIESISGQGFLRKGKFTIKNLRLKDNSSLLMLDGTGQFIGRDKSLICNYQCSNLSLAFVSYLYNVFKNANLDINGFLNGRGQIAYQNNRLQSQGIINLTDGQLSNASLKKLDLSYDIQNIKQLSGTIKLSAETLFWKKTLFPKIEISLLNSWFNIYVNDAKDYSLAVQGQLNNFSSWDCAIDSFIIYHDNFRFTNTKQFTLNYADRHLSISNFAMNLGNGTLALDLSTNSTARPDIDFKCHQIDLKLISDILQLKKTINGTINGNVLKTSGNSSYSITLLGENVQIPIGFISKPSLPGLNNHSDINLKYIETDCRLNESELIINKTNIVHIQDTSRITGKIDLIAKSIMDDPLDVNISFADPGTWVFFFLKDIIDVRDGKLYGEGKISGTLNKPMLNGSVKVSDVKLFIVPTRTSCDMVNGELVFDRQNLLIRDLNGKAETGKIKANGYIHLEKISEIDTMSYQVEFQNAPIRFQKEVLAIATGNLNIEQGTPPTDTTPNLLFINGNITIKEALLTPEFSSPTASNGLKSVPPILNLKIIGDRDIWLRNQLADVELSCDLNVITVDKDIIFSGQLNAIQGSLYYLDHTLKLSRGVILFDNTTELNPELDISADLETRPLKIQSDQAERIKIILTLSGRLKEPEFTFTSDPSILSNEDIMSYLAINVTWQEMTASELRETFTAALSDKLLGYFERELTKRLRGYIYLDYLWFESGLVGGTGAKVTVGKYIGPKLYFTYEYNISQTANDVFRLEYYMTKAHQIIGERDDENRYNLKYQYKIRY